MSYFLKQTKPSNKGLYLQIYESYYIPKVGKRNHSFITLGYVSDLIANGIEDPIRYARSLIDELNQNEANKSITKIGDASASKNVGYFLLKAVLDSLDIDNILNMMSVNKKFKFKMSDFIRTLIYAQIANPGSKLKAIEKVIPNLYNSSSFSYDQILDGIEFIGANYEKFIELFNNRINNKWPRNMDYTFFDCTNYYFEIDIENEDRRKGPSKEGRHSPIIGQALLLDANQIPVGMMMYPGNQSEKPFLRRMIEDTKGRYDITGKVIQVADKGLNCARNIYSAVIEAHDGYIFSKSVHGKYLSKLEKKWILLDNEDGVNQWVDVLDENGKLLYRYKECIDDFEYHCYLSEDDEKETYFKVQEKRVVTFNPSLAKKQREQILKEVEKIKMALSIKEVTKEEFGDALKYIQFEAKDEQGKKTKIKPKIIQEKIDEDLALAGYNLLVSSETNMSAREIYNAYHGLWRIEESFRIMKTYLEARPVFLQKKESIYGHFLICYLSLVVLRLLELKVFKDKLPISQIVEFIRQYTFTDSGHGFFVNSSSNNKALFTIKAQLGLFKLDYLFLKKRDLDLLFDLDF